jgi:hypothetical protein
MHTLQQQLERELKENGESDPVVQMLRNQITAEQSGKNFQELYSEITELEESVNSSLPERFRTLDPNSVEYKIAQELCDSLNATVMERGITRFSYASESDKNIKK